MPLLAYGQTGCASSVCVLTGQNDNNRDSYNGQETVLTPTNVPSASPAFQLRVDSTNLPGGAVSNPISAQPLYVSAVQNIGAPAATHNILIVATLNGTVFAFDADNKACNTNFPNTAKCWSREGANALAYDCGSNGTPLQLSQSNLPFFGVVSTPIIDVNLAKPSIFLTSMCTTGGQSLAQWYLHRLSLLDGSDLVIPAVAIAAPVNAPSGSNDADALVNNSIQFQSPHQNQRPALLEVPNPNGSASYIYVAFGTLTSEDVPTATYHGWVFAYDTSLTQQMVFASTTAGCGPGGGTTQCTQGNGLTPSCDCLAETHYGTAPNWGGHGGGIWMSTRGLAASKFSDGSHVYLGVGNGGFQTYSQNGLHNFGESILDMRVTSSGPESTPFQSFTPNSSVIQPSFSGGCDGGGTPVNCAYSYQNLNAVDYDMSTSGVLLFNDANSTPWLVTLDKGGYGYLLKQKNFAGATCTTPPCTPAQGFVAGDPGNAFPFAPIYDATTGTVLCTAHQPDLCHRVTSLALFPSLNGNQTVTQYLYFWPFSEILTGLVVSDNTTQIPGPGTISGSGSVVTLSSCGSSPCFNYLLVAGDKVFPNGYPPQTVTAVSDQTHITVNPGFTTGSAVTWKYSGYFINPAQDIQPPAGNSGYAGGALAVSANGGTNGVVWAILAQQTNDTTTRSPASLYGYQALPLTSGQYQGRLQKVYLSAAGFCSTPFALPTVASGKVYVPTFSITTGTQCTANGVSSGVLVYAPQP